MAERAEPYPCDDLLPAPDVVLYRAIDVGAPSSIVFRWLCQLRVAPYSYDWIDNLGRRSPRELGEGLEQLAPGQRVMRIFRLESFERDRHLTLRLDDPLGRRVFGELVGTYRVTAHGSGSRIVVKLRLCRPPGALGLLGRLLPFGDWIMMRKQLLELKAHAERTAREGAAPLPA
jgi:hypothetical protein